MRAKRAIGLYPANMHPGLVPGFSVEELKYKFGLDKLVFGVNAVLIIAFVIWGVTSPETVSSVSSAALSWGLENFGWLFNVILVVCIIVMLGVAMSRYGNIKLGKDDEEPEYSRFSWVAMMFAAGIGVGIFFFGPSEPLEFYHSPPPLTVEPHTEEALHRAVAQADFHWGFSPWALYALVGGALAYSTYRRGRASLISSLFAPILKRTDGPIGRTIDILAIVATLFGTAASLGIATLQIGEGISTLSGFTPSMAVLLVIIFVLSVGFIISAVSGVSKGIRLLSNTNIMLTFLAIFFVFVTGPTLFLVNLLPSSILTYLDNFLDMSSRSLSWGPETLDFQAAWTVFYWAWWIAWAPFVGMFIARISRGRTIREFILVTIIVPTFVLMLAFAVFGGTAMDFARNNVPGFDGSASAQQVLYNLIGELPFSGVVSALVIVILAIFFITSADSASVVMGTMASKGDPEPNKLVVVFFGVLMMGIAVVMLLTGGEDALSGLQSLTILTAMPFVVIIIALLISFVKDLTTDPQAIRTTFAKTAVRDAVIRGLEEYGNDFELAVERADEGQGVGSVAGVETDMEQLTEWYQHTNEMAEMTDGEVSTSDGTGEEDTTEKKS
ncbi:MULTISPECIES: BCCT family transporter [Corynebacterium]|uniref:BCCT family transporter n=1 Tax=Corynebacterium TaxID=1716 RepID=UPI0008A83B31|nr:MULTISPECIES: BCCT family transporter [Corynebacterium]MDK7110294.1 BCCT family transporter [Corynebacterium amycolatum]MDK7145225.1 BCCT family transporter [Corynebacterium amycolatum]OHR31579.1 choline transporter [Corynebacterium sp. HMSC074C03]